MKDDLNDETCVDLVRRNTQAKQVEIVFRTLLINLKFLAFEYTGQLVYYTSVLFCANNLIFACFAYLFQSNVLKSKSLPFCDKYMYVRNLLNEYFKQVFFNNFLFVSYLRTDDA